jgi:DNA-binding transcriptional LysR family regulator
MANSPLDDLRLADVITFLTVRRQGTVTGAARELNVTPSQVSKAVARLEQQLRLNLLNRSSRGVLVSDSAARVVPHLEEMVARLRLIQRNGPDESHELTLASPSYLHAFFLPRIAQGQPQLRLRALQLAPALVRAYASENVFEAALTLGQERMPKSWVSEHVGEIPKGLFANVGLAKRLGRNVLDPEVLKHIPFVSPVYTTGGKFIPVDDGCPLSYGERRLGHEVQTIGLALEMAVISDQLVFGPRVAALPYLENGSLVELRVRGWEIADPLYLACNVDRVLARVQRALLDSMRGALEDLHRGRPIVRKPIQG